jgi:hypothetical protein
MEQQKIKHFLYCPFTGLGLYNGYRGDRWLRNRIQIFKQFVLPSLLNQSNKNFVLWISWRPEERNNLIVKNFMDFLKNKLPVVHTFWGCCFYDDKYPDAEARARLTMAIHRSVGDLFDTIGEAEEVYMTIQPSDDCYASYAVEAIQSFFAKYKDRWAVGFAKGYICNYLTKEVSEYNPKTNPPFVTIRFPREVFVDPWKHLQFTSLKHDIMEE